MKAKYQAILVLFTSYFAVFLATYFLHNDVLLSTFAAFIAISCASWLVYHLTVPDHLIQATTPSIERRLSIRHDLTNDQHNALSKRLHFSDMLKEAIEKADYLHKRFAVLLVNLERTNNQNKENHDHSFQKLTNELISSIKTMLKPDDTLAYINDDELVILVNNLDKPKLAGNLAQRIIDRFSKPQHINGHSIIIKAMIGIAIYPIDGVTIDKIIESAQKALYKAKVSGKQLFQFHTNEINLEPMDHKNIQTLFKKALQQGQIVLQYQPIYDLTHGEVNTVQALMRWEHPQLGIINPNLFIQTAEEAGLIGQLSEWMIREACQKIKKWESEGYESINIVLKISPTQFLFPTLISIIRHVLIQTAIIPNKLHLSISEKVMMKNVDVSTKILNELNETGATIGIDHFGSGLVSVGHLSSLPIAFITIDRSLISSTLQTEKNKSITSAIISLSKDLDFEVIAEGVETGNQLDFLINHNCDKAYGYLLSYPVPADKIIHHFNKTLDTSKKNASDLAIHSE